MEIEQKVWGFSPEGEAVILYTMRNKHGGELKLTNIGAAIVAVTVPDRDGELADVALGYESFDGYFDDGPAMGKTPGRYANRIENARFEIDGKKYNLIANTPPHQLHGGTKGFANKIWESRVEVNRVVFSLISPDGDQGYPGELSVEVVYDWDDDYNVEITYLAKTDAPTYINLTNHAYFNLAGQSAGRESMLNQTLQLNANSYLATDEQQIPTGEKASVADTPMDFRKPKKIGKEISADFEPLRIGNGYDHCWVVDGYKKGELKQVAILKDENSGRTLTFLTTQPGVQVYTGNYLEGCPVGKGGKEYGNKDGVAIECQAFPNSPNQPDFPSQRLNPDEIYKERIIYKFSAE